MKHILLLLTALMLSCCSKEDDVLAQNIQTPTNMTQNTQTTTTMPQNTEAQKMYITIDGKTESVTLAENSASEALVAKLQQTPVTVTLNSSGGFEIWGALGFSLPTSNEQINAQPGDVILYNGSNICIFYGTNSWSYTRLGKIDNLTASELKTFLKAGESDISITLSLKSPNK